MDDVMARSHGAMLFASLSFSIMNVLLQSVHPNALIFCLYRDLIASPLLLMMAGVERRHWKEPPLEVTNTHVLLLVCCGLTGIYGQQLFFLLGLSLTNADTASIWQPVSPALTAFLAVLLGLEKPSLRKFLGVLLGCGSVIMMSYTSFAGSRGNSLGHLCLFANTLCAAVYILLQKPLFEARHSALFVTAASYGVGALTMVVTSLCRYGNDLATFTIDTHVAAVLAYSAVVCSACAYAAISYANQHIDATVTASYGIVQPVVTALLSWLFLGVVPTWQLGVAGVLVAISLVLISWRGPQDSEERELFGIGADQLVNGLLQKAQEGDVDEQAYGEPEEPPTSTPQR